MTPARALFTLLLTLAISVDLRGQAAPRQTLFPTPEDATQALLKAADSSDQKALSAIFGPEREKLLTGDPVEDNNALQRFAARLRQFAEVKKVGDAKVTLLLGLDKYPFAVPLVKTEVAGASIPRRAWMKS